MKVIGNQERMKTMKTLIIYSSIHHGNTKKIADEITSVLNAELRASSELDVIPLEHYDLIGFGSGIFHGKHHEKLFNIIRNSDLQEKDVFVFATSGTANKKYCEPLKELLAEKKAKIRGSFICKGYDTYGILKWIGGLSRGRPNHNDIKKAREFGESLISENTESI